MRDWNVVVSIYQSGFRRVLQTLQRFGQVARTGYYNVLVMKVDEPVRLLETLEELTERQPALYDAISRVAPAMQIVEFHSQEEFQQRLADILATWAAQLAGRTFHLRVHRRGAKFGLGTQEVERRLDETLLAATSHLGAPARIDFSDPDYVIAVDAVDERAGVSLWTREDLARHRLLRPD